MMKRLIKIGKTEEEKIESKLKKADIEISNQIALISKSTSTIEAISNELNELIQDRTRALVLMDNVHNEKVNELIVFEKKKTLLINKLTEIRQTA